MFYRTTARLPQGETPGAASVRSIIVFVLAILATGWGTDAHAQPAQGAQRSRGKLVRKAAPLADASSPAAKSGRAGGPAKTAGALFNMSETGPADAPVTIVEFSDLQCPFCRRAVPTVQELLKAYPGKIRLIYKHAPLAFHDKAPLAHEAVLAAGAQGKFWEMHDLIVANPDSLERAAFDRHAARLGLDLAAFREALDGGTFKPLVERDLAEARALGVDGVPTFFINGRKLTGAKSLASFKAIIDEDLGLAGGASDDAGAATNAAAPAEINIKDAPVRGSQQAPLTMVLFTDFQCPFCARINPTLERLLKGYGGKVKLALKHFPLNFHADAPLAHEAAAAAGAQGKFWEMHDLIFAAQGAIKRDDLLRMAKQVGLDEARFAADLDGRKYSAVVEADKQEGARLGVGGTPTVFINGKSISGAAPIEEFRKIIDAVIPDSWREPATDDAAAKAVVAEDPVDPRLTKGAAEAPVTLVWFSDIQSSLTPKAAELVRQVLEAYPGKIRLVFKHRPLELRPEAVEVHEAALAAAKYGKFWEMHDLIVANQKNLKRENLLALAAQLGLPRDEFARALEAKTYRAAVEKDLHEARRREVRGTPVFFVNGVRIDGLQPLKLFREAVDAELSKTEAGAK